MDGGLWEGTHAGFSRRTIPWASLFPSNGSSQLQSRTPEAFEVLAVVGGDPRPRLIVFTVSAQEPWAAELRGGAAFPTVDVVGDLGTGNGFALEGSISYRFSAFLGAYVACDSTGLPPTSRSGLARSRAIAPRRVAYPAASTRQAQPTTHSIQGHSLALRDGAVLHEALHCRLVEPHAMDTVFGGRTLRERARADEPRHLQVTVEEIGKGQVSPQMLGDCGGPVILDRVLP